MTSASQVEDGGKMRNAGAVVTVLLLSALSLYVFSPTLKAYGAAAVSVNPPQWKEGGNVLSGDVASARETFTPLTQQSISHSEAASAVKPSLPSPFLVAAAIVGLVALFGGLLSLYFGRHRGGKPARTGVVVERFWAID